MKSILFIEKKLRIDKIGILYLSSILKNAGYHVDMIQDDVDNAEEYIAQYNPQFIMYSVMSGEHQWYIKRNRELKEKFVFVSVMGGPHFTFFPEQGIEESAVDYVVQGPGENVILDIVEGKCKEKFVVGTIPNVEELPHPDRSILYKYDEFGQATMKRFIAARYCYFSCKYCFNHIYRRLYKDQKWAMQQRVSPKKMVEEILAVKNKYPLEMVYFNDDDFPAEQEWVDEFCREYKEKINLPFCGSMRAGGITEEMIKQLADAGCTFMNMAIESANRDTQIYLRRAWVDNESMEIACWWCKKYGIKVRLQNMIGLPVDDPLKDALDTLKYNIKVNPTDSWASIFQPFGKTDIWYDCVKKGLIDENTQAVNFYENTPLRIKNAEKINRLHKWWFFIVKHQLPMELVHVLLELPLTEEHKNTMQQFRWNIAKGLLYGM